MEPNPIKRLFAKQQHSMPVPTKAIKAELLGIENHHQLQPKSTFAATKDSYTIEFDENQVDDDGGLSADMFDENGNVPKLSD